MFYYSVFDTVGWNHHRDLSDLRCLPHADALGLHYTGDISITYSGKPCLAWWIHENNWNPSTGNTGNLVQSHTCRNPDGYLLGPWCLVKYYPRKREMCCIQLCASKAVNKIYGISGKHQMSLSSKIQIVCF